MYMEQSVDVRPRRFESILKLISRKCCCHGVVVIEDKKPSSSEESETECIETDEPTTITPPIPPAIARRLTLMNALRIQRSF